MRKLIKDSSWKDKYSISILFIVVFSGQAILASNWSSKNVFAQFNIIFDADPSLWMDMFTSGWGPEHIMHPLGNYLISIPIRVIDAIGSVLGIIEDKEHFKMQLALYVAPFFTALKGVSYYIVFRLLKLNEIHSLLATGFAVLSFSSIVFGSTPSSYPLSGYAFVLTSLCAISIVRFSNSLSKTAYYFASVFAVGITASNILFIGWLRWFINMENEIKPVLSLKKAITNSFAILAFTIVAFFTLNFIASSVRGTEPAKSEALYFVEFLGKYVPPIEMQIEKALRFPEMMTRTIVPTVPVQNPDTNLFEFKAPIKVELSYIKQDFNIFSALYTLVAFLLIGGGAFHAYRISRIWQLLTLSSVAIIVSYWIFYSWIGLSIYLYSQTWHGPVLFLMSGWLSRPFFNSKLGIGCLVTLLLAMFAGNLYVLQYITKWFVPS